MVGASSGDNMWTIQLREPSYWSDRFGMFVRFRPYYLSVRLGISAGGWVMEAIVHRASRYDREDAEFPRVLYMCSQSDWYVYSTVIDRVPRDCSVTWSVIKRRGPRSFWWGFGTPVGTSLERFGTNFQSSQYFTKVSPPLFTGYVLPFPS